MDIQDAIYRRRAVREYAEKPVDHDTVVKLIEAAIQAPSAMNQQPWTFTVIRDQGMLDELSRGSKEHILKSNPELTHSAHFQSLNDPHFQIFYHAPILVLISAVSALPWYIEDCALAAQNLMLAAYAVGLGTCWIGFAQNYLNTPKGKHLVGLDPTCAPVAPIIVGVPRKEPEAVSRKAPQIRWVG